MSEVVLTLAWKRRSSSTSPPWVGVEGHSKPVETIETNVRGTEVVKTPPCVMVSVLIARTLGCLRHGAKKPFNEKDEFCLGPPRTAGHAASKMVDEFLGWISHEYGLRCLPAGLKLGRPAPDRQYGMVIPRLIGQDPAREPMSVYGDGRQSRCFWMSATWSARLWRFRPS
jgi:UDP-glucose 4-epimerase